MLDPVYRYFFEESGAIIEVIGLCVYSFFNVNSDRLVAKIELSKRRLGEPLEYR